MLVRLFLVGFLLVALSACQRAVNVPSVEGVVFPSVVATKLSGESLRIPEDLRGKTTLLLVGYAQRAQFDLDRWILGVMMAELPVSVIEVPTIEGIVPGFLSDRIDEGMRSGIPQADWPTVATVYDDAKKIVDAIGNDPRQNGHAVLLDTEGRIIWRHNQGYSPRVLIELKRIVEESIKTASSR